MRGLNEGIHESLHSTSRDNGEPREVSLCHFLQYVILTPWRIMLEVEFGTEYIIVSKICLKS
jgi:hypothetical protein